MAFSIEQFKNTIRTGLARPNRYKVFINSPYTLITNSTMNMKLCLLCERVTMPGCFIATGEEKMIMGPVRKMPYINTFEDMSMTFMCTEEFDVKRFFNMWQNAIVDKSNGLVGYYADYVSDIEIQIVSEKQGDRILNSIKCFECYPISMYEQELSYEQTDTYLQLIVNFAYRKWEPIK